MDREESASLTMILNVMRWENIQKMKSAYLQFAVWMTSENHNKMQILMKLKAATKDKSTYDVEGEDYD